MVRMLGTFVSCESPSHDKRAVDRFGKIVANEWRNRGANVRFVANSYRGNHVRAEICLGQGRAPERQIMVLGHLDTVYPVGTLAKMPFRISGGRAWGPGTFDMKGGLVLALFAVDALKAVGIMPAKKLVFLWTSDEEIGSESSSRTIEIEARRSDAVLVLEPSFGSDGRLKTARKGVGTAEIIVTGRSAHAGVDPEKGVNAVHELALQIERLMKLNNRRRGITVQTTVVTGGTVSNVIPDYARAEVDIRFSQGRRCACSQPEAAKFAPNFKGCASGNSRRNKSTAAGTNCRSPRAVSPRSVIDARYGIAAGRGLHWRRIGRKSYRGSWRADSGWTRSSRRLPAQPARARHHPRTTGTRSIARWVVSLALEVSILSCATKSLMTSADVCAPQVDNRLLLKIGVIGMQCFAQASSVEDAEPMRSSNRLMSSTPPA